MADGTRARLFARSLLLGGLLLGTRAAQAQPLVRVQAGSQVVLFGAQGERGLSLNGALLDDLGAPLADRALALEIERDPASEPPRRISARSAADGSFAAAAALPHGIYRVRVRFEGDSHHTPSEIERTLDLNRADVRLAFVEPRQLRLDLDAAAHRVSVRASSARGGGELSVELADERGGVLAHGRTDSDGIFRVSLASSALGSAGSGKLIASTQADTARSPARVEIAVLRWRGTRLSLDARRESDHVAVEGRLSDRDGGLAGKAVGLFDGDAHVATLLTDRGGHFRHPGLPLPAPGGAQRVLSLQARFESDAAWIGSSRSAKADISLAPELPPNPSWLLAPLLACALLVWLLFRRAPAQARDAALERRGSIGIHPGRGRARGRPEQRTIEGVVRDATSERPVRGATVTLRAGDDRSVEFATDAGGRFRSHALDDGAWQLEISAPGYATLAGSVTIAHRGEWSDVQVQLQSLRAAALLAYKPAALRMLPAAELWQRFTPRETLASAVKSGRATEPFAQLTQRVEQAAYARTPPSPEDVAAIEQNAREALARFPNEPSQPGGSGLLRATFPHRR